MTDTVTIAAGPPSWADLSSHDMEATKSFYSDLFGWTAGDSAPEFGGYFMFFKDGKEVAGAGPTQAPPGQPPAWLTYVSVDDAAATTEKARSAGGQVVVEPMQVGDQGTMAVIVDPTGAVFGLWQPGQMKGAGLFNEPGSVGWNELATRDLPAAGEFYGKVFDWELKRQADDAYTEFLNNGKSIAGMMGMGDRMPAEVQPHWLIYFVVSDIVATAAKAIALGGDVKMPPTKTPEGTFAVIADTQGAVFAAIEI